MILNPDTCMYELYDAYIYVPRSLTLKQACVYDAYTYDPWSCYMYVWCIYDDNWSSYMYDAYICVPRCLTLMLVCMMHISMILDSCMYDARMVHASIMQTFLVTDQRTDGQGDSRSLMAKISLWSGQNVFQRWFFIRFRGVIRSIKVVSDFCFGHRKCLFWYPQNCQN